MQLADSEAQIYLLRDRAGGSERSRKTKRKEEDLDKVIAAGSIQAAVLPTTGGHINFFEDLEENVISAAIKASKKADPSETEKGVPLAPLARDLNPRHSEKRKECQAEEVEIDDRR